MGERDGNSYSTKSQNRWVEGKERKGGEGAEGLEDIRGKTNEGIRSLPHGGVSFEKMR
jgi:hypothetical protein